VLTGPQACAIVIRVTDLTGASQRQEILELARSTDPLGTLGSLARKLPRPDAPSPARMKHASSSADLPSPGSWLLVPRNKSRAASACCLLYVLTNGYEGIGRHLIATTPLRSLRAGAQSAKPSGEAPRLAAEDPML
jgi:hypothetical protein